MKGGGAEGNLRVALRGGGEEGCLRPASSSSPLALFSHRYPRLRKCNEASDRAAASLHSLLSIWQSLAPALGFLSNLRL